MSEMTMKRKNIFHQTYLTNETNLKYSQTASDTAGIL